MPDFAEIFKNLPQEVQEDPFEMWMRGTRPEDFLRDTTVGGETLKQSILRLQAEISGGTPTGAATTGREGLPPQPAEPPKGMVYGWDVVGSAGPFGEEPRYGWRLFNAQSAFERIVESGGQLYGIKADGTYMEIRLPEEAPPTYTSYQRFGDILYGVLPSGTLEEVLSAEATSEMPLPELRTDESGQQYSSEWKWSQGRQEWVISGWKAQPKGSEIIQTWKDEQGNVVGLRRDNTTTIIQEATEKPEKPADAGKVYSEGGYDWEMDYDWDPQGGRYVANPERIGPTKRTGMTEAEVAAQHLSERQLHQRRQEWESDVQYRAEQQATAAQQRAEEQNRQRLETEERGRLEWANFLANPRNAALFSWLQAGRGQQQAARLPSRYEKIWEQEGRPQMTFPPTPPGSTGPPRPPGAPPPNIFDYPTGAGPGMPTQALAWEMFKTGETQLPGLARPFIEVPSTKDPFQRARITAGTPEYKAALGMGYEPTMPQQTSAFATAMRVPTAYEFLTMTPEARMTKVAQLSQAGFPMETEADLGRLIERQYGESLESMERRIQSIYPGEGTGETAGAMAAMSEYYKAQETARKQRERQRFIPGITRAMRGPSIFRSR